jgi:hypothetical protein
MERGLIFASPSVVDETHHHNHHRDNKLPLISSEYSPSLLCRQNHRAADCLCNDFQEQQQQQRHCDITTLKTKTEIPLHYFSSLALSQEINKTTKTNCRNLCSTYSPMLDDNTGYS